MSVALERVADPAAVCAEMIVDAVATGGQVVLAGGSTPRAAYELAAERRLDWSQSTLWFGDERCVEPQAEQANFAMVKDALLDRLADEHAPEVRRIRGELGPTAAAADYEALLSADGPPRLDLVLLGLGPDGHTASLFPSQPSLEERARLVVGVEQAGLEPFVPRVTMTLPALALGARIVFLAVGEAKARAVAAAFGPNAQPDPRTPASLLVPLAAERITVLLDDAAAGDLA
jgi:6-phosphogluconolactonase